MLDVKFLPPAAKYLKKIKDKKLKDLYKEAIREIQKNPDVGESKTGDLAGVKCCDIFYNRTNYELAYTLEEQREEDGTVNLVVVIMAGTRENFYKELKEYWL